MQNKKKKFTPLEKTTPNICRSNMLCEGSDMLRSPLRHALVSGRSSLTGFIFIILIVLLAAGGSVYFNSKKTKDSGEIQKKIQPVMGSIQNFISTTGSVLPKNRLEVKPPVNGRIDSLLVKEGDHVKAGQTLGWMSSTERAALLDSARGQGEDAFKYWEATYKAIPLISPIDGEVIVATTQPGQTVATSDAVIVLSDKLIVRAQVDETDIGKVKVGQKAVVSLDAYPDTKINSVVDHMYYESKTVNNVTIYEVDLIPEEVPIFFRSGMNSTIDFLAASKDNVMLIPIDSILKEKDVSYVLLVSGDEQSPERKEVKVGIADDKNVEIVSGLNINDTIVEKTKKYSLPKTTTGSNPFMPQRKKTETPR
jgi:macrolide-specific efflux system membrane fusion protein